MSSDDELSQHSSASSSSSFGGQFDLMPPLPGEVALPFQLEPPRRQPRVEEPAPEPEVNIACLEVTMTSQRADV